MAHSTSAATVRLLLRASQFTRPLGILGVACLVAGATPSAPTASAQATPSDPTSSGFRNPEATRAELQSLRDRLQREAASGSASDRARKLTQAAAIEGRLTTGDFQPGDRFTLYVQGQPTLSDTFTVRDAQIVHLPNLADVSLHGVLHSELQTKMSTEISRYIRDATVRAGSLVRLAVLGPVLHPGFYALPADMLVSDAIMHAGGLTSTADVAHAEIKRGTEVVEPSKELQQAMRNGQTLDQLSLRDGDELVVAEQKPASAIRILQVVGLVLGVAVSAVILTRRH